MGNKKIYQGSRNRQRHRYLFIQNCVVELLIKMYPYEITLLEKSKNEQMNQYFDEKDCYIQIGPKKFCFHSSFPDEAEQYYNVEIKKDDLWIVTYPRSGTTWTQELLWLLTHDLDFKKAKSMHRRDKFFFLELSSLLSKSNTEKRKELFKNDEVMTAFYKKMEIPGYESVKSLKSPRCIKSHIPLSLLPPNLLDTAKVIYVARNPKDCAVSNYYHNKGMPNECKAEFERFWPLFREGLQLFGPQIEHVKEGWELRNHRNVFFLFYEELKQDLPRIVRELATFLGKDVLEEDVNALVNHLSFENMKSAESKLPFPVPIKNGPTFSHFRQGEVGYIEEFINIGKKADEWVENQIKSSGIPFHTPNSTIQHPR